MVIADLRDLRVAALAPLQTLTDVMHQIDPLAPGQRIDATTGDAAGA